MYTKQIFANCKQYYFGMSETNIILKYGQQIGPFISSLQMMLPTLCNNNNTIVAIIFIRGKIMQKSASSNRACWKWLCVISLHTFFS